MLADPSPVDREQTMLDNARLVTAALLKTSGGRKVSATVNSIDLIHADNARVTIERDPAGFGVFRVTVEPAGQPAA